MAGISWVPTLAQSPAPPPQRGRCAPSLSFSSSRLGVVCCAGLSVAVPGGPAPPASNYITQFNQKGGAYHQGRAVAWRERWLIVSLVTVQGLSYAEVARRLMLSNAGVRKIVLRFMALRQVLRLLTSSLRRHGQDLTRACGTVRPAPQQQQQFKQPHIFFRSEARTKKTRERGA